MENRPAMTYPMSVGRKYDEILHVNDALQTGDANRIATPADWMPGGKVIMPMVIKGDEARMMFPQVRMEVHPCAMLSAT